MYAPFLLLYVNCVLYCVIVILAKLGLYPFLYAAISYWPDERKVYTTCPLESVLPASVPLLLLSLFDEGPCASVSLLAHCINPSSSF